MPKLIISLGLILCITGCSTQGRMSYKSIDDTERIQFQQPGNSPIAWYITGSLYKAINPIYIANKEGFTIYTNRIQGEEKEKKVFELIAFSDGFTTGHDDGNLASALTAGLSWNYYINDQFMPFYMRVLACVLKPHSIERVEYVPNDTMKIVHISLLDDNYKERDDVGAVKITTRETPKDIASSKVLYLADNIEITPKIFEAINPIYIKSLQRITDKNELKSYQKKRLKEVVKIEFFSLYEVQSMITSSGGKSALLINNIEFPIDFEKKFYRYFFKKIDYISEGDEGYLSLKRTHPDKEYFTIISL